MIRQDIRIGGFTDNNNVSSSYKFVVDLLKYGADFNEDIRKDYVFIRKYNVVNEIVYDTDVYIIEKELLNDSSTAFPLTNGGFVGFANNVSSFNPNYNEDNFKIGNSEVYEIYQNTGEEEFVNDSIPCDKIRIYHPHNKVTFNGIIYIDAQLHTTHFHILCRPYTSYKTNAEKDFEIDHLIYTEYVECIIPNMEFLMSGKAFYKEHFSMIDITDDTINQYIYNPSTSSGDVYAALKIFSLPFMIVDEKDDETGEIYHIKKYVVDESDEVEQDYIPLRVTLSPYTYIDNTSHLYVNDTAIQMNSDIMQNDYSISLSAKCGFDDEGHHSIVCSFKFPHKNEYGSFREAYEHYYHISLNDYEGIVEFDENDEEDDPSIYVEQKQCGFVMNIYSDVEMTQRVMQTIYEIDQPSTQLDDFAFRTNSIFDSWSQLPDILVIQCIFVDKWLGNVVRSNPVIISQDTFKYFINNDIKSVSAWTDKQQVYDNIDEMDKSKINFIENVRCIIRKSAENTDTPTMRSGTKVLYKPLFFRTQDLQSIQLRKGLVQNIGINLSEYMTKVSSFKLTIAGQQIVESARNDIYVIFSVNAQLIGNSDGTYHISNQDDEYISSGKYTMID